MSRSIARIVTLVTCVGLARAADPGSQVQFIEVPKFNSRQNAAWGPVLTDIVNHEAPGDNNPFEGLVTLAHETTHGINAHIRNNMHGIRFAYVEAPEQCSLVSDRDRADGPLYLRVRGGQPEVQMNGFYALESRGVLIQEPAMFKRDVIPYVPVSLRGPRYQLYVVGQTAWDDMPLYLFDEWTAYVNGALTGVNLVETGLWHYPWQDAVFGPLEFTVYCVATAMAIKVKDPQYFASNQQMREYLAFNIARTMDAYRRGSQMSYFKYDAQEQYLQKLRTGGDAAAMRDFLKQLYGSVWTSNVLGF